MLKKSLLILTLALIVLSSCKKKLPEVGGTSAQKLANEWWVQLTVGGADIYNLGHFKIMTYNTSANDNTMWVDDLKHGYGFKSKATADYNALTFSATKSANEYYDPAHPTFFPLTVNLSEGKVLPGVGHSRAGNVTDSIYMKAVFSDDPTTTYVMAGTARTMFIEDEY